MAAGLAHEVRNQLNALQLHVQILEQELGERLSDAGSEALDRLHRMTRALDELDDFLSEFLRLAHPPPVIPETIALAPLLRELVTFLGPEFAARGVALETDLARGADETRADGPQLKRALLNLALNALSATPKGGRVTIETRRREGTTRIAVRDTGSGIAPELRPHLFEPFVVGRPGGVGLGLPIASRIVEQHGGRIEVESTPGRGSVFTVVLPGATAPR
jgi:two-component system, NtrC family, sensor histidine kinase HydH